MSLEARLKHLERASGAERHILLLWEEGDSAPFDAIFFGSWQEAEKVAEISRLRAKYPSIPLGKATA